APAPSGRHLTEPCNAVVLRRPRARCVLDANAALFSAHLAAHVVPHPPPERVANLARVRSERGELAPHAPRRVDPRRDPRLLLGRSSSSRRLSTTSFSSWPSMSGLVSPGRSPSSPFVHVTTTVRIPSSE